MLCLLNSSVVVSEARAILISKQSSRNFFSEGGGLLPCASTNPEKEKSFIA